MSTDGTKLLEAGFAVWRRAFLPAGEGGFQPPGLRLARDAENGISGRLIVAARNPPGWKPGSTSARMADATTGATELFWMRS